MTHRAPLQLASTLALARKSTGGGPAGSSGPVCGSDLGSIATHVGLLEGAGFVAVVVEDPRSRSAGEPGDGPTSTLEPLTLLAALATTTQRIGLVATASTATDEPFHVARRLASLDHLSGGRAGWKVDTGGDEPAHRLTSRRLERAEEFAAVVRALWDSNSDQAIVADKRSGMYLQSSHRRPLDHVGPHFRVAGPMNLARPPQGHPVVFAAIDEPADLPFASRNADVVITAVSSIDEGRTVRAQLDALLASRGRSPGSVRVWARLSGVVGQTTGNGEAVAADAEDLAERIVAWHGAGATDGVIVDVELTPPGADRFAEEVVPVLAERGVLARADGRSLRGVLGLPRPERSVP